MPFPAAEEASSFHFLYVNGAIFPDHFFQVMFADAKIKFLTVAHFFPRNIFIRCGSNKGMITKVERGKK